MSIYRGAGGAGDAVNDASSEAILVQQLATEAQDSADAAATSETNAAASASSASSSASAASTSASNAATSATNASNSASSASTSATNAANSATAAQTAETAAELAETNAETAETNAETAATNAASSASAASTAATNASNSASAASTSATNASNSASAASTSASNASTSATSASNSASSATTSASNASTSETNASNSATSASTSATTATTQAGIATTQASNASTSATNASNSATSASTSASTATTQATNASNSASAAATSATNAAASYDAFDDRYLGSKSSAPSVDNDGNALLTGALYFDTVSNSMKVYNGTSWLDAYASLSGALIATNNLSDLNNTATARTNLGLGTIATQAASNVAITGGAVNGTTIGASTASTGAFTTLSATGVATFSAGTNSAPAITTTGDTNTGIFFPAADTIAFTEGGVESMRIDSSGNVGIGTSSPNAYGGYTTLTLNNATTGAIVDLNVNSTRTGSFFTDSVKTSIGSVTSIPLAFLTGATERMRLDASGNLGLGVTPSAWTTIVGIKAIQVGGASLLGQAQAGSTWLSNNAFFDGANKYIYTGFAQRYAQSTEGQHQWFNAPSGTAGNAITFTQAMTLDASGNLGIGTTSPTQKLHVVGRLTLGQAAGQGLVDNSNTPLISASESTGSFAFNGHLLLQPRTSAAGAIIMATGNGTSVERMRIDSSGNVGIGTTSPSGKFNVGGGRSNFGANSETFSIGLAYTQARVNSGQTYYIGASDSATPDLILSNSAGTERMRITNAGDVGIGVVPKNWTGTKSLSLGASGAVYGDGASYTWVAGMSQNCYKESNVWKYTQGSGYFAQRYEQSGDNGGHYWFTAPAGTAGNAITFTEAMTLNASGNLGIGTSSPGSKLVVVGNARLEGENTNLNFVTAASGNANISFDGSTFTLVSNSSGAPMVFSTNSTERMRIDSSGNVMVGTTSTSLTGAIGFKFIQDANNPYMGIVNNSASNSVANYHLYSTSAGAYRFYVGLGGTIYATSIVISAISDERLKENIKDIDTGLNSIMALKPRRFDWKDGKGQDKKNVAGFIAQEFETVFPECVSTTKAGADGIEYKNINHETLIPTLVKAMQEQQALIENLTTRLNALEGK
jgi:hypothetical protein